MTRKHQIITIILLLTGLGAGIIIHNSRQHYSARVFISGNGWGYNVLKGKKTIIHQPFIPCVEGNQTFADKSTAQRTGNLIVKKLRNKQTPRISINELNAILKEAYKRRCISFI